MGEKESDNDVTVTASTSRHMPASGDAVQGVARYLRGVIILLALTRRLTGKNTLFLWGLYLDRNIRPNALGRTDRTGEKTTKTRVTIYAIDYTKQRGLPCFQEWYHLVVFIVLFLFSFLSKVSY